MLTLRNQGIVLGEDYEKMSKSRGNVVAPDNLVKSYGADSVRAYLMFFARWDLGAPWNKTGIDGTVRWLRRVWTICQEPSAGKSLRRKPRRSCAASCTRLCVLSRAILTILNLIPSFPA